MLFSLLQTGFVPRFCSLKGAKDVDEFLKKYQADSLRQQMYSSLEINEFIFSAKMEKYNTKNPNEVAKLEKELLLLVDKINDKVLQKHYRLFFQKKIWELKFQGGFRKNKNNNNQYSNMSTFGDKHTTLKRTNINDKERQILAFLFLNRDFLVNDELNENVLPKFIKKNQKIFEEITAFDFENDSGGVEIIGSNYVEYIKKIQANGVADDIFKNLVIGWELEYLKISNLPENIKQKERKKILEKKENMLLLEGES
jgi:DNA primase